MTKQLERLGRDMGNDITEKEQPDSEVWEGGVERGNMPSGLDV